MAVFVTPLTVFVFGAEYIGFFVLALPGVDCVRPKFVGLV